MKTLATKSDEKKGKGETHCSMYWLRPRSLEEELAEVSMVAVVLLAVDGEQ